MQITCFRAYRHFSLCFVLLVLAGCASQGGRVSDIIQARALSDQGLEKFEAGDYKEALKSLNDVIAFGSIDDRDYTRRASVYGAMKKYEAALRDTDHALQL